MGTQHTLIAWAMVFAKGVDHSLSANVDAHRAGHEIRH